MKERTEALSRLKEVEDLLIRFLALHTMSTDRNPDYKALADNIEIYFENNNNSIFYPESGAEIAEDARLLAIEEEEPVVVDTEDEFNELQERVHKLEQKPAPISENHAIMFRDLGFQTQELRFQVEELKKAVQVLKSNQHANS